ncbi:MAG: hypothetical protein HN350_20430, partial [Phycisphaerales bacterium]|nr:hypothetical protein [Phycisphaerales bacterium]
VTDTLASKYVAEKLKLTAAQKTAIAEISTDSRAKRSKIYGTLRNADEKKRTEARKQLGEISAKADEAALKQLTKEQKKAFEKMKGKKFEIKRTPRTRTTT